MVPEAKLVLIRTKDMVIIGSHTDVDYLVAMADAKIPHDDYYICDCTEKYLKPFHGQEVLLLAARNKPEGQGKYNFKTKAEIRKAAIEAMYKYPISNESLDGFKAKISQRLGNVTMTEQVNEVETAEVTETVATEAVAEAPAAEAKVEKDIQNGVTRPKAGSKTGRVWEIADSQGTENAVRKTVMDLCVAEGINASTASTQYGKWRKYNGLGKEVKPAEVVDQAAE